MADFFGSAYVKSDYWNKQNIAQKAKQQAIEHVKFWGWENDNEKLKKYLDQYYDNNNTLIFKSQFCKAYKNFNKDINPSSKFCCRKYDTK